MLVLMRLAPDISVATLDLGMDKLSSEVQRRRGKGRRGRAGLVYSRGDLSHVAAA